LIWLSFTRVEYDSITVNGEKTKSFVKMNINILSASLSVDFERLEGSGFGEVKNLINLAQISGRDMDITLEDLPC